jgi:hypothetical protein
MQRINEICNQISEKMEVAPIEKVESVSKVEERLRIAKEKKSE